MNNFKNYIHNQLNIISKFNWYRLINIIKLRYSFYYSILKKRSIHYGMPFSLSVEPTNVCNLHCPECPSGTKLLNRERGYMDFNLFKSIIDQLYRELIYLILYFQGEPYLNKNFFDFIKYAVDRNIYTTTSTNGHFFDSENVRQTVLSGLDSIIISIDGATQESYAGYRQGGQLQKVIEGTKNLVKIKKELNSKKPYIIVQFIVLSSNQNEIEDVRKLAAEIGADEFAIKTAQIYDFQNGHPLLPSVDKYSRYKKLNDGTYILKRKIKNYCWRMWSSSVITWDGNISPCCFDKDNKYNFGNINEIPFKKIWKGKNADVFRNKLLIDRKNIDICNNCTE
jgi:radical SAM protein with 4Fe4S-binding SPASM domain